MNEDLKKFLFNPTMGKIATIIFGALIIWIIIKATQRSMFNKIKDKDNRYKAKKFSNIIGYLLTIVLLTVVYSDKLGGLTVAFGVAGAGIAFALQEIIVSFAGWIAIILGGYYKTGDRIQLAGIKGDVMDIGVIRTTIMEIGQWVDGDLYNGRMVSIANSFVFKEPVFNYSGDFPFLWDEIKIPIQYGSNYEKAKEIFESVGKEVAGELTEQSRQKWLELQIKYRLEDAQTEPLVSLIANDNWVEYTLRYIVSYKKRRITKSEIFTKIVKIVEATNGEIKFASSTYQLVDGAAIKIKMEK
ncbi:MAG TPA: mechanosensitive ion channel domain-containing protein [Bacteroidia bacterium]|nr:mechanosensitive ion channel domain-containing protein [Bacteroidia bacterium]